MGSAFVGWRRKWLAHRDRSLALSRRVFCGASRVDSVRSEFARQLDWPESNNNLEPSSPCLRLAGASLLHLRCAFQHLTCFVSGFFPCVFVFPRLHSTEWAFMNWNLNWNCEVSTRKEHEGKRSKRKQQQTHELSHSNSVVAVVATFWCITNFP